jgi:DNA invertase Pin-like site-specific DNA recombinase
MEGIGPTRVAAYVRMSTVWQDQSVPQQLDFIGRYAAAAQCTVVKVYRDDGKSGLSACKRPGLLQMLADIGAGNPGFEQVLVYDISRFGRFQDVDESSYYEYWCRQHGIAVVYCGEQFANDGSPLSHIIKSVKRTMAAEYSRALSVRTFEAHAFLLERGFKPGGAAGYGMRRVCLRADGSIRRELSAGERKGHLTDRVVLAPGPLCEVELVRRIYRLYIEDKLGYRALARQLTSEGLTAGEGVAWSETRVKTVLTNEKYCGVLLYNRSSSRLGRPRRRNDAALWLRHDGAHEAVVSPAMFAAAKRQAQLKSGRDRELVLQALRALHARHGTLATRLIDKEAGMPHTARIVSVFGSLHAAYVLAVGAGACVGPAGNQSALASLRRAVERCTARAGGIAYATSRPTKLRILDVSVSLTAVRCRCRPDAMGWLVPAKSAGCDFVLAALLDEDGAVVVWYALLDVHQLQVQDKRLSVAASGQRGVVLSSSVEDLFGLDRE